MAKANYYTIKHSLRTLVDVCGFVTGLLRLYERKMQKGLTVLMYHRVLPENICRTYPLQSLPMPVDVFDEQMKWLAKTCNVLPLHEALSAMRSGQDYDKPLVSITFDDGYEDNFHYAAPVLQRYGLRATFCITVNFLTEGHSMWFDRAADAWSRLEKQPKQYFADLFSSHDVSIQSWMKQLKNMNNTRRDMTIRNVEKAVQGHFSKERYAPMSLGHLSVLKDMGHEIASHSLSHPILTMLSDNELRYELQLSSEKLSELTGGDIYGFCFPNGTYNERVLGDVKKNDYIYALTTEEGANYTDSDQFQIKRIPVTMQRTMAPIHAIRLLNFRSEISRLRAAWRSLL